VVGQSDHDFHNLRGSPQPEILVSPKRNVERRKQNAPTDQIAATLKRYVLTWLHIKTKSLAAAPVNAKLDSMRASYNGKGN